MKTYTKASNCDDVSQRETDNRRIAYQAACESIVLLKNDGTLPLKTKKVALYGPGASMTIKGGTGSGEVNERHSVSILEGMEDRGFEICSRKWLDDYAAAYRTEKQAHDSRRRKLLKLLKSGSVMDLIFDSFRPPAGRPITADDLAAGGTDTCVYVLSRQAGEGGDRKAEKGDMFLSDGELEAIRFCARNYDHFVLVINCGSSIDMSFAGQIPGINAIVYICQPGTEGGHAFADILSGSVTPSGHLADTWAKNYSDLPFSREYSYLNGDLENEFYKEGIYVGYRFFDSFGMEPAYPFGFGLSYTSFSFSCGQVQSDGRKIIVPVHVTNTGDTYSGKAVCQLYVSAPNGQLDKEYQSLAAFGKTSELAPGASQEVSLSFDLGALASYRERDSVFVLEKGEYILRLGQHSRDTVPVAVLALPEDVIVSRHQAVCPCTQPLEELKAPARANEPLPDALPRIPVDPAAFQTVSYTYETPPVCPDERVQKFLSTLTLEEMVEIVVGIGFFGGETRFNLPGSVGNTTSRFWDRGLANVALCDGPAGLRIQQRSAIDKNGKIRPAEFAEVGRISPLAEKLLTGNPEKDTLLYQYATAFPVAAALAQSWNTQLMEQVGQAVYREMKEYGCTYWLAPAINIHRNPLCGRNFEYFSEDPRLTGLMAAAITRGVQQEDGYYVTVKHFACNNQEDNRTKVSSNLSERALREIYLRGFEETVRSGGAKAVMTSYNKINGVYAPNSYDLCTKVLRCEWGFDGVVMTDWFSTAPGQGDSALAMKAGNDLIMPGGSKFKKVILKGVSSGRISEEDVRRCCANVVRSILNSATQKEYIG